ncbi:MAG: 16S rRNA (adenine(1518)-N(6)/adenine(1519)-N(6))-dimethyltransferase RsmA [Rhizobiales bacterium]|nr:16S rRNA (adenine(1518)-N(6)/adenine(1519)-N(6))-dimethyltransferase RsmA [Hyphomicrobiales bacterium]
MIADGLPPLREVIRAHGLEALKSLGQNFLLDFNITAKIARHAGPLEGVTVIEVGPGPGGLTRALLAAGARRVIAIERDTRCIAALREIEARYPDQLTLIEGDALKIDFAALAPGERVRIVSNLPYNIGTELLIGWLRTMPWPPFFESLTLMFQREVARRIVATPAQVSDYGRLGILAGWRTQARIEFDLPPSAFTPPPKVTSSVVTLVPRTNPLPCRLETLERVTAAAFNQRRKMLRQSLKSLSGSEMMLNRAGIEPTARPETLPVEAFVALANAFDQLSG